MKKIFGLVTLALGLTLIVGSLVAPASAAPGTNNGGNITVSATVQNVGNLTLSQPTVNFPNASPANPSANLIKNAEIATVQTNSAAWTLTQGISTDFPGTAPNKITLNWENNGGSSYLPMGSTTHPDVLNKGSIGTEQADYPLDYSLTVPWTVAPNGYSASVVYTLSY